MITLYRAGAFVNLPSGFSWTTLIFGFWPAALRGQAMFAIACILLDWMMFTAVFYYAYGVGGLVLWFLFRIGLAFMRNEDLAQQYIKAGWRKSMATKNEASNA